MAYQIPTLTPSMFPSFESYLSAITDQINAAFLHIPSIQTGSLTEVAAGWYTVQFSPAFSTPPKVVAFQGQRSPTSEAQTLSPPSFMAPSIPTPPAITAPTIEAPTLPGLPTIPYPPLTPFSPSAKNPGLWSSGIDYWVKNTLGPNLQGKFEVNLYFAKFYIGNVFYDFISDFATYFIDPLANELEALYWAFDWPAGINAITGAIESKISGDINNTLFGSGGTPSNPTGGVAGAIDSVVGNANKALGDLHDKAQTAINDFTGGINKGLSDMATDTNNLAGTLTARANSALASLTTVTEESVNALFALINAAAGLGPGDSIPVAQYRNVTSTSFQIYHPGGSAEVSWVAVLA